MIPTPRFAMIASGGEHAGLISLALLQYLTGRSVMPATVVEQAKNIDPAE